VLLRDRLIARLAEMGAERDDVRLAAEVLGIRNAPPALARALVEQALVVEDRRDTWLKAGQRIVEGAPARPGVYVLRDEAGRALYVGKANDLRRRLRTHFAARRWKALKPEFARAAAAEWCEVGSEIEALVREAEWIRDFAPPANVQVSDPSPEGRAVPASLVRDTLLVLPAASEDGVVLLGVRASGAVHLREARRDARGLAAHVSQLRTFFRGDGRRDGRALTGRPLAPLVFSWLSGRGHSATRLDPHDAASARELQRRVALVLEDSRLFTERIVVIRSGFRSTSKRP
jgi:predicted GIY-YIG superfamily endonuclease